MGYRSEWKLAIAAATKQKLNEMLKWMLDYSTNGNIDEESRDIMEFILGYEVARSDECVEFEESSTKCYSPWDSVLQDIFEKCEEDPELDVAYARLGEEQDDNEIRQGDWTYVYIERRISDIDYGGVPEYKEEPVEAIFEDQQSQEEKCGCGKMKDAGKPCWWCGHNG